MDDESARSTRRERQIAARLEQILDAAARLFASKGFHRTTTKEIAEAADVAEGTLYNYFESKNDMLLGIMDQLIQSQPWQEQGAQPVQTDVRQVFADVLHYRKLNSGRYMTMQQAILSEILADEDLRQRYYQQLMGPSLEALERQMQLHIDLGQVRPLDPRLSGRVIAGTLFGLFLLKVVGDPVVEAEWDALVDTAVSIFFDGLVPSQPSEVEQNSTT